MSRSRNYCFTSFLVDPPKFGDGIKYLIYGREVCPRSSRVHWQSYVEFNESVSLKGAARRLDADGVHFERRKGTAKEASDYCKKDGAYVEHGEISRQGKRSDLDSVRTAITDGSGMRGVIESGASYQAIRYAEKYLTYMEPGRAEPPKILWYWGTTGTGKTREAVVVADRDHPGDCWWTNGGLQWFDGYDAHKAVIFDDFRPGWCKLPFLLRLFDRYSMRVPYKGGFRSWVPELIIVTAPKPPAEYFAEWEGEDLAQLVRRISEIREFE